MTAQNDKIILYGYNRDTNKNDIKHAEITKNGSTLTITEAVLWLI